jgi:hypothetical protein
LPEKLSIGLVFLYRTNPLLHFGGFIFRTYLNVGFIPIAELFPLRELFKTVIFVKVLDHFIVGDRLASQLQRG